MNERGLAESTQWALVMPVTLASLLGLVQTGVWLHGRTVASEAAATAAGLQAGDPAPDHAAERVARDLAHRGGLEDVEVLTVVGPDAVSVTVTGRAPVFFDLGQSRLREKAVLPRERASSP